MRTDRGKNIWDRWDEMVKASKDAEEDFNDFMDDNAIIQADRKIKSLQSKLKASQDEVEKLQADNKKKKNRIGILNRSLRRLKKE